MSGVFATDVVIVGGCGRVGLPLGLALASRGLSVVLYDLNAEAVETVNAGRMPFAEDGAEEVLREVARAGLVRATTAAASVGSAEYLVVVGTPVDEHLNPDLGVVPRALDRCAEYLWDGQLIVLRSTVHPGVTRLVERQLAARGLLAKLFTNTWRYVKFATANQFWMMANDAGLDYARIRHAITFDYPRAADVPMPGFAAGPCLLKDTMQLAAFNKNNFVLGHAAMLINEGLPLYLVSKLEARFALADMTVGILGMAFKGGSDDPRESLAYKLRKLLVLKAEQVLCTDPHVVDPRLVGLEVVLAQADLLLIAAPHRQYASLATDKPLIDMWGLTNQGVRV